MLVESITRASYFATFIDDYCRKTWIYFLKTKYEAFIHFRELKSLMKNQTWKNIKVLRSNNGGQYKSNEFQDSCREEWINKEFTVPYNPQ